MSIRSLRRGFTLIELLLVIGIIAILAAIVIVAINPTKQLGDARNAQRRSDVNSILNALYQFSIDHDGNFPNAMSGAVFVNGTSYNLCKSDTTIGNCPLAHNELFLPSLAPNYLIKIPADPRDPTGVSGTGTSYRLSKSANGRITVSAPIAEGDPAPVITVTR